MKKGTGKFVSSILGMGILLGSTVYGAVHSREALGPDITNAVKTRHAVGPDITNAVKTRHAVGPDIANATKSRHTKQDVTMASISHGPLSKPIDLNTGF